MGKLQAELIAELEDQDGLLTEAHSALLKGRRANTRLIEQVMAAEPGPPVVDPGDPDPVDPDQPTKPTPPTGGDPAVEFEIPDMPGIVKTIKKPGGAGMTVKQDNVTVADTRFMYGGWMGISVPKYDGNNGTVGLQLLRNIFHTGWAGDQKGWGVRAYDMALFLILECLFICDLPFAKNVEHGFYFNIWGGGEVRSCVFYQIPGQPIQLVGLEGKRAVESANAQRLQGLDVDGDVVLIDKCQLIDCGHFGNGRASFQISMFDSQVGMTIRDTQIIKTNEARVHGAILFMGNNRKQPLTLERVQIHFTGTPDREAVQVWEAESVTVDGGSYKHGKGFHFIDCGPVTFSDVQGDEDVWFGRTGPGGVSWYKKSTIAQQNGRTEPAA